MDIPWCDLQNHLDQNYNLEVDEVQKDRHCFPSSLQKCLIHDHGLNYSLDQVKELIRSELLENIEFYREYFPGSNQSLIRAVDNYINHGIYTHNIIDCAVIAGANALCVNLCILTCQ